MQAAFLKLLLLSSTLSLGAPWSYAKRLDCENYEGRQRQMKLQEVVLASVVAKQVGRPLEATFLQPTSQTNVVPVLSLPSPTRANKQPAYPLPVTATYLSSPVVEPDDQMVVGLSLGSVLSAGSAQQSVNQEGVRDEAAKRDAAKGDAAKQNSRSQQTLTEDAVRRRTAGGKRDIESAGGSGNGSTASGSADGPSRRTPAQENW